MKNTIRTIALDGFKELADLIARNVWFSTTENHKPYRAMLSQYGEDILFLEGTVIEPAWELFEPICNIYGIRVDGSKYPLYVRDSRNTAPYHNEVVRTGSWEEALDYLKSFGETFDVKFE